MKSILSVHSAPASHWVGDGFPVRSMFSYASFARQLSPFRCWIMPARLNLSLAALVSVGLGNIHTVALKLSLSSTTGKWPIAIIPEKAALSAQGMCSG